MEAVRRRLRDYELSLDRSKRKRLGQFFTGARASSLLASLSFDDAVRSIVDPMAGHGDLLDAVATRAAMHGQNVSLTGVEIDAPTSRLAEERLSFAAAAYGHSGEILNRDAFTPAIWRGARGPGSFDLVIANPPYVRYQSHSATRAGDSQPPTAMDARSALRALADSVPDRSESRVWLALVEGYSGLADLSVPSWLLCAMLVRPGGTLALVVPKTWMNRDYATILQYLQLRFFQPSLIVEEHGVGWFEDALVPATLVVSRRLSVSEALVPLTERAVSDSLMTIAAIRPTAADTQSLVGRVFPTPDPDGAFMQWLGSSEPLAIPHIAIRRVPWAAQQSAVLSRARHESWFKAAGETAVSVSRFAAALPPSLTHALGSVTPRPTTTLERLGFQIGQGLRTGCNAFFYVQAVGAPVGAMQTVRVSDTLGGITLPVPTELLRPVVRRQSEVSGFAVDGASLAGRVLVLHGWALPEDAPSGNCKLFPERLAALIRRAATTAIGPPGRQVPIPELSAVRTNNRTRPASPALFTDASNDRYWYMLPDFAPRHQPVLAAPRVNSGSPYFFLNTSPPTLIDANFSTIYSGSSALPPPALLALLNSTWSRACAECIGTPMGGGALKFEATQLRELPIPSLDAEGSARLSEIGQALSTLTHARTDESLSAIDTIVFAALFPNPSDSQSARNRLLALIADRQEQRVRAPKEAIL